MLDVTPPDEQAPCAVCGGRATRPIGAQPRDYEYAMEPARSLSVFHCAGCGSRFVHPRPSPEELVTFYPLGYHAYHDDHGLIAHGLVRLRACARARGYLRLVSRRPVRLFDVGTGDCRHFAELSRRGAFEFAGVELKPEMAEAARRRGYAVSTGTLESFDVGGLKGSFDLVTMYQLLEHALDPLLALRRAWELLRPGGWILGQLPRADSIERGLFGRYWAGYHYPRHLQMFTQEGLRAMLGRTGFEQVRVPPALHLQAGLSLQNWLVGSLDYRPAMTFGKTPVYPLCLLAAAPFCLFEYLCGRGGMMDFRARKPAGSGAHG